MFVRKVWHMVASYRAMNGPDGLNTGNQHFAHINSWPDKIT
ncbi:hypothetical protein [Soonwooa sp.]|nr:hypothetical protein [Soonwooa sp.]